MSGLLELSPEVYEQFKDKVETLQQTLTEWMVQMPLVGPMQEHNLWIESIRDAAKLIEEHHGVVANEEKRIAAEKAEILAMTAEYRQEIEAALQQAKKARAKISLLSLESKSRREEMTVLQRTLDLKKSANQQKIHHLSKALSIFQNFMAIEVCKIKGGKLQFVFRHINPSDPSWPCVFTTRLLPQGGFEVMDCQPPISCMPELLSRLRETKNMPAFISRVRKAFQATF